MKVYLNNSLIETTHESTLEQLLVAQNLIQAKGMAVAVNNSVVSKMNWANFILHESDKIVVIKATQGG